MDISVIQQVIQRIFSDITPPSQRIGKLEYQWIMDTINHHYQVLITGWEGSTRVHDLIVQIDIKDGFVWVQQDNTDYGVAQALIDAGIPKEQIVLGFHSPTTRPLTGFAVG
jgi:hypothetical protein